MSDMQQALILFGAVCLASFALVSYVIVKGDWWRP